MRHRNFALFFLIGIIYDKPGRQNGNTFYGNGGNISLSETTKAFVYRDYSMVGEYGQHSLGTDY